MSTGFSKWSLFFHEGHPDGLEITQTGIPKIKVDTCLTAGELSLPRQFEDL